MAAGSLGKLAEGSPGRRDSRVAGSLDRPPVEAGSPCEGRRGAAATAVGPRAGGAVRAAAERRAVLLQVVAALRASWRQEPAAARWRRWRA